MKALSLVLTCEHAGNNIPEAYQPLFTEADEDLQAHTGWDPGAWVLMTMLSQNLNAPSFFYPHTRLLIEANRSEDNPQLFSKYTSGLSPNEKQLLLENYYRPYRQMVTGSISELINKSHQVIHLSVHSFTSIWNGEPREVEIGLLFDESRTGEREFCTIWENNLNQEAPHLALRLNEPYRGTDDGFTTHLRQYFLDTSYLGIELEVSQKFVNSGFESIQRTVLTSLKKTLKDYADSRHYHLRRGDQKD